jgi:hypothetical protein
LALERPGFLRLKFSSKPGRGYAPQFKPALSERAWTDLGFILIGTSPSAVMDLPLRGNLGFFRILETE